MSMNTVITPKTPPPMILGPNYLDCQHKLTVEEYSGIIELQVTFSSGKITVDIRGEKPNPIPNQEASRSAGEKCLFGIRLISLSPGEWVRMK